MTNINPKFFANPAGELAPADAPLAWAGVVRWRDGTRAVLSVWPAQDMIAGATEPNIYAYRLEPDGPIYHMVAARLHRARLFAEDDFVCPLTKREQSQSKLGTISTCWLAPARLAEQVFGGLSLGRAYTVARLTFGYAHKFRRVMVWPQTMSESEEGDNTP